MDVACRGMRPAPEILIDLSSDFAEFSESDVNHLDCIKSVPLALQREKGGWVGGGVGGCGVGWGVGWGVVCVCVCVCVCVSM